MAIILSNKEQLVRCSLFIFCYFCSSLGLEGIISSYGETLLLQRIVKGSQTHNGLLKAGAVF